MEGGVVGGVPDGGEVVDCVGRHGKDGALGEMVVADGEAGTGRDNAGEAEGGGGVDTKGFGYYVVKTTKAVRTAFPTFQSEGAAPRRGFGCLLGQILHRVILRHINSLGDCFVQFPLQPFHHAFRL